MVAPVQSLAPTTSALQSGAPEKPSPTNVGGQAVLEGVMMRAPGALTIVVRRKNGELVVRERTIPQPSGGIVTWPFFRGGLTLFSSLRLGSRALRWSAEIMEQDLAEEERLEAAKASVKKSNTALHTFWVAMHASIARLATMSSDELEPPADDAKAKVKPAAIDAPDTDPPAKAEQSARQSDAEWPKNVKPSVGGTNLPPRPEVPESGAMKLLAIVPIVFALGLFVALPQGAAEAINAIFKLNLAVTSPGYQVITGVSKLCIVVTYLSLIRLMPDVRRVFQYHGAEHKAISTYELQKELILENARPTTALHARCGTTFIIMVAFVSVVVFSIVGAFLPPMPAIPHWAQAILFFLLKLPLLPVIAGLTYELQRFFAKYCSTGPLRALLWPGFIVQKITTAEPDDSQLEVALASLKSALARARVVLPEDHPDRAFPSYGELLDDPAYAAR